MKKMILAAAVAASMGANAQDWKGVGEFGLAITGGNTDTQTINGKLGLGTENDAWKHDVGVGVLNAKTNDTTTAKRYDFGWTSGYKLSDISYLFGALRYENDDFGPFDSQSVLGLGYGIYAIKDEQTNLLFEVGPGYRRTKSRAGVKENDAILRGKMDFNHKLNETTAIYDTFLLEAGSDNKFMQNDLGLAVKLSEAFALKTGFQIRRNSDVVGTLRKTDRLFTTNLVYAF